MPLDVEVEDRACGWKDAESIERLPYTNKGAIMLTVVITVLVVCTAALGFYFVFTDWKRECPHCGAPIPAGECYCRVCDVRKAEGTAK